MLFLKGEEMKEVCATCKWLEELPFSNEFVCTCDESEYADCPSDNPEKDTCEEWTDREG